jgi:hypothetical protein
VLETRIDDFAPTEKPDVMTSEWPTNHDLTGGEKKRDKEEGQPDLRDLFALSTESTGKSRSPGRPPFFPVVSCV